MTRYANAYTEVYGILEQLSEEDFNKIPPQVVETIRENQNSEYDFELDEELELKDQKLLPETKAILFNLFRDYLSEPWQKEKIIKMQAEERYKNELEKHKKYENFNVFQNNIAKCEKEREPEHTELVKYKETIFKRIINKIKSFFHL